MKKQLIWFFDMLARALNPFSYRHISDLVLRIPIKFFFLLMTLSTLLYSLLSIPTFYTISDDIAIELDKFDRFDISVNASTSEPILFPKDSPYIAIDLSDNVSNQTDAKISITSEHMIRDKLFSKNKIMWKDYKDITDDMEDLRSMLVMLFVLLSPLIILLAIIRYSLMFLALSLFATAVFISMLKFTRFRIGFEQMLKISIFSCAPAIFYIMTEPYSILHFSDIWRIIAFAVIYLIYISIGTIKTGSFDLHKKTKTFK